MESFVLFGFILMGVKLSYGIRILE